MLTHPLFWLFVVVAAFLALFVWGLCASGKRADKRSAELFAAQAPDECVTPAAPKRYETKPRPCCGKPAAVRSDGEFHARRHVCTVSQSTGDVHTLTATVVEPFGPEAA